MSVDNRKDLCVVIDHIKSMVIPIDLPYLKEVLDSRDVRIFDLEGVWSDLVENKIVEKSDLFPGKYLVSPNNIKNVGVMSDDCVTVLGIFSMSSMGLTRRELGSELDASHPNFNHDDIDIILLFLESRGYIEKINSNGRWVITDEGDFELATIMIV